LTTCAAYFQARLADFQTFADPLVYTPGDNEWTDCHRANNGGFVPTERLGVIRQLFFARPGRTLGREKVEIAYQSRAYPENVAWSDRGVIFGAVHVVGSNDDRAVWFADRKDAVGNPVPETRRETALRTREYTAREAATLDWLDTVFDAAERTRAPGVVIAMQADMLGPDRRAERIRARQGRAGRARRALRQARPAAQGRLPPPQDRSPRRPAGQPTRIVVQGSTNLPHEWSRIKIDPSRPGVFSCQTIEFVTKTVTPCPAPLAP
jgi:hypothetical protein